MSEQSPPPPPPPPPPPTSITTTSIKHRQNQLLELAELSEANFTQHQHQQQQQPSSSSSSSSPFPQDLSPSKVMKSELRKLRIPENLLTDSDNRHWSKRQLNSIPTVGQTYSKCCKYQNQFNLKRPNCHTVTVSRTDNVDHNSFDGNKKSRCILFSQIYLFTHISITICLNQTKVFHTVQRTTLSTNELLLNIYLLYLITVSLIFFLLLRCYHTTHDGRCNELTVQSPVILGALLLGLNELIHNGINVIDCSESEFVILPLLKFAFSLFLMHFLLTHVINSERIGLRNIAIAHLLTTQISLWILSIGSNDSEKLCRYSFDWSQWRLIDCNQTETKALFDNATLWFKSSLNVLIHQYRLLTIFVFVTMWFTNNQSKINFIRAKLSDEEVLRCTNSKIPLQGWKMWRGFAFGSIMLVMALISVGWVYNKLVVIIVSILLQVTITITSSVGLLIRKQKKNLNPKYQINVLKHHVIISFTLFIIYIECFTQIMTRIIRLYLNTTETQTINLLEIVNWITLVMQITFQTYLLRLHGKKLLDLNGIFSLLATANFALWLVNIGVTVRQQTLMNRIGYRSKVDMGHQVLSMFVTLNRYYSSLLFVHFWKLRV